MLIRDRTVSRSGVSANLRSEFLQEAQHQVPQGGAEGLVVVADDVCGVLLQLDQSVLRLQVQDVSVRRLLHLHLRDAALTTQNMANKIYITNRLNT